MIFPLSCALTQHCAGLVLYGLFLKMDQFSLGIQHGGRQVFLHIDGGDSGLHGVNGRGYLQMHRRQYCHLVCFT